MSGRDKTQVRHFIDRLSSVEESPKVSILDVPGADDSYFVAHTGPYRIIFRYIPSSELPGMEDPRRRDVMVASIVRRFRQNRLF